MTDSTKPYNEEWLEGPQSTKFYTRTYTADPSSSPKAALVFIHGFAEHIKRYAHFHPRLAARGVHVFTFDQRGFGETGNNKEKRSRESRRAKTAWVDQMGDVDWAIGHVKKTFSGLPVFIMGQSMGGGEVLSFATLPKDSPYYATAQTLAGVIATSPLIEQTKPASRILRWVGHKAGFITPYTLFPAQVAAEDLTKDQAIVEAVQKDPLCPQYGTLRGLHDMLSKGEELKAHLHRNWPRSLPVLIAHGTKDRVTSHEASKQFYEGIVADKKKLSLYDDALHELQNETDGVQDRLLDEVIAFIEEHSAQRPQFEPTLKSNL